MAGAVVSGPVVVPSGTGSFLLVRRHSGERLRLSETVYSEEVYEPDHPHARPYFEVVLRGAYADLDKGRPLEHRSVSVAYQPAIDSHTSRIHPGGLHSLKVEMATDWLASVLDTSDHPAAKHLEIAANYTHGPLQWLAARLNEEWRRMDSVSGLAIEGLVLEMIAETVRCRERASGAPMPRSLCAARDLIRAQFADPLTLEQIAGAVGVHPVYLARAFREKLACTVGEYVRRVRIEYASDALARTDAPIGEIAQAAGFADQSAFTKAFRRVVGMTPAAYRSSCGGTAKQFWFSRDNPVQPRQDVE